MINWWNWQLIYNDQLIKWPIDEMTNSWHNQMGERPMGEITNWLYNEIVLWLIHVITNLLNDQMGKRPVGEMTKW